MEDFCPGGLFCMKGGGGSLNIKSRSTLLVVSLHRSEVMLETFCDHWVIRHRGMSRISV